ncbi:glycosyltransferase family 2 protein [Acidisoma silvae]|uniref:Glycosyltransferase family 2 protein n=1 Tax=Acidisoma silvae TaxID=2802396 RepID=A0A964E0M7_9PROT|nr:glycosyltransferase [Acidisoma silvae]MCB8877319.1 glycosyltransferase family 2 protein [Acidisoma silvae]
MFVEIGIATLGRPGVLSAALDHLLNQTRLPDRIIICAGRPDEDVDQAHLDTIRARVPVTVVQGTSRGSSAQRNAIIEHSDESDILLFLDDDFFPANSFISRLHDLFAARPTLVVATGLVLADGATGPGIEPPDALTTLMQITPEVDQNRQVMPIYNGYGCNMAVRADLVRKHGVKFDEALPLYSWLEDVDFSRQLSGFGEIVQAHGLLGVHLGIKRGRVSGQRFGYAQIANPIYLARKGTMAPRRAYSQMTRNILRNFAGAFFPEPWVDRRGRVIGNTRAFFDLIRGRLKPANIITMS